MSCARIYRVGSPFNGSELSEGHLEPSADTMYFAHLNHAPTKLVRAGHTSWTFSSVNFTPTLGIPTGIEVELVQNNTVISGDSFFPQLAKYIVTAVDDASGMESRASVPAGKTND